MFVDLSGVRLLPGEDLRAEIRIKDLEGWLISREAVGFDNKGAFVFQVDDEHAKRVNVNVLGSADELSVIQGDIDPEKKIVQVGNYQIADGDALRVQEVPSVAGIGNGAKSE